MLLLMSLVLAGVIPGTTNQQAIVRGSVIDAGSGRPVPGAVVRTNELSVTTDAAGRFRIAVAAGDALLVVTADGYLTESSSVAVHVTGIDIEIRLVRQPQVTEAITVTGARETRAASREVTPLEVTTVAGAADNIFRVLQTLPGVAAADEFGSRLSVRGGGPDQNLTLMDGVEIYNPYRLFGLTSAFNPETIQRFELTAGGFSAKYGDRLSSLLVVENRRGDRSSAIAGSVTLGLTDANIVAEGRVPGVATASWLVTGRRTYYDIIAEPIVDTDLPSFGDLQTNLVWEPRAGRRVTVFGLTSRESADARLERDVAGERFGLRSNTSNSVAAISFATALGTKASSATIVSWYRNREIFDVDAGFRNESRRANRPDDDAVPMAAVAFARTLGVRDLALRQELSITAAPAHIIDTGFEIHGLRTEWSWRIVGDRNPHEANASTMFGGSALPAVLDSNARARRAGAWVTDRWALTPRLQLEPGVRVDWSGLAAEVLVSPRLALSATAAGVRWRAAGGLFTQSPGYEKLLQSDYFVDLTGASALGLRSERAWHGLAGAERRFTSGLVARVEGYYKRFDRLVMGRLETPQEVAARIGGYDFPETLIGSVPIGARVTSIPSNTGRGRAFGVDVYLAREQVSPSDRWSGWLSYTLGKSEIAAYQRRFPFDYDRTHALSAVMNYRLRASLDLAATIRAQSGFPYTPAIGVRAAATPDEDDRDGDGNTAELAPQLDREGLLVWEADMGDVNNMNAGRLPPFVRVDVRVTFRPRWAAGRWQFYIDVINVLNRRNAGSLEPVLEYDAGAEKPRVASRSEGGLPLLPSLGIRYRF